MENIDLIFHGVEYLSGPTILGEISVSTPTKEELEVVKGVLKEKYNSCEVWAWDVDKSRLLIAGHSYEVNRNKFAITSTPFELIKRSSYS